MAKRGDAILPSVEAVAEVLRLLAPLVAIAVVALVWQPLTRVLKQQPVMQALAAILH